MTQGRGDRRERREIGGGATGAIYFVVAVFSLVWIGAVTAYVRGYFGIGAEAGINPANWGLAPHVLASLVILGILPPLFLWIAALSLHRAAALSRIATELTHATRRLSAPMDAAREEADTAAAGFERRIQAMASALDGLDRTMKDIEDRLGEQIAAVQAAGRQIGTEAQQIEKHLAAEREALRDVAHLLGNEASQVARMFGSQGAAGAPAGAASPEAEALAEIGAALSGRRAAEDASEDGAGQAAPAAAPARDGEGRALSPLEELTAYLAHHRSTQDAAKALALMKKAASEHGASRPGEEAAEPKPAQRYPLASDLLGIEEERAGADTAGEDAAEDGAHRGLHLGVPGDGGADASGRTPPHGDDRAEAPAEETVDRTGGDDLLAVEDEDGADAARDAEVEVELELEIEEDIEVEDADTSGGAPTREAALAVSASGAAHGEDGEEDEDRDADALTGSGDALPSSLALDLPKGLKTQLEGLHALTIDLNRLLGTNPPVANWRRYMNGERDVFTLHFIRWAADRRDNLATAYAASEEFRKYADRYLAHHARLAAALAEAEGLETQATDLPDTDVSAIADLLAAARDARMESEESEETGADETT